jgi:hypothetical protein
VISRLPSHVTGTLSHHVPCLSQLPYDAIAPDGRTILVLGRLAGEEEVPPGVAAVVVLGDCPDILSHAAVRARNCRVPVVACPRCVCVCVCVCVCMPCAVAQLLLFVGIVCHIPLHTMFLQKMR